MATAVSPPLSGDEEPVLPRIRTGRLAYLDNLKFVLVAGVIMAHAATYYIGGGAWINHQRSIGTLLIGLVGVLGLLGGLFWIGLFFLIAGLLAPGSLAHHGIRHFLRERALRLGIPFLAYVFLVMPLLGYPIYLVTYTGAVSPDMPWTWITEHSLPFNVGPLWFVADLLLFSAVYAVWWQYRPRRPRSTRPLDPGLLAALAILIGLGTFAVHLVLPLYSPQFLDLHLTQWPQYIALFWLGTMSAERGWLVALPDRLWRQCGLAVITCALALPVVGAVGGALSGETEVFTGGLSWQAFATAMAEGILAVAGSLWMLDFFRRRFVWQEPFARNLTRCAYGAYVAHEPILISTAAALVPLNLPVEISFLILAPVTAVASYALAWMLVIRMRVLTRIL